MKLISTLVATAVAAISFGAHLDAQAQTYNIDPSHTFPAFEADHMGISKWRGKVNKSKGVVTLDRAKKTGTVTLEMDANSVDFGHQGMNDHAKKPDIFNVEKFPTMAYKGTSMKFEGDNPVEVMGELTLLGVTKPVNIKLNSFKCIQHPRLKREVCGADGEAKFNRGDFGMNFGMPFNSGDTKILVTIEAVKAE
jgi:polyisoprenoid-binding protein YceI